MAHFSTLGIDITSSEALSALIKPHAGVVTLTSFVNRCTCLRGPVKLSDIAQLARGQRKLENRLIELQDYLSDGTLLLNSGAPGQVANDSVLVERSKEVRVKE